MKTRLQILLICLTSTVFAQTLHLPPRAPDAPGGSVLAGRMAPLSLTEREEILRREILSGNVPDFYRRFCPVNVTNAFKGQTNSATFYVAPEYLAVGSAADYLLMPVSPNTAQFLAEQLDCVLPTPKMVDAIYEAAAVKLVPAPIPPTAAMTTVAEFAAYNETIRQQRAAGLAEFPLGSLVAGHKKDVVVSARLAMVTNKVAIYGWHRTNGVPIQPLFTGHTTAWVDYSHGIRLVLRDLTVNGQPSTIPAVLADPQLCGLLSDEGVITNAGYPTNSIPASVNGRTNPPWLKGFTPSADYGEMTRELEWGTNGRVLINAPAPATISATNPVRLILYALPNGNSIEQTIGRQTAPGDDWHFDIQHIGAQTRWLRAALTNRTVVVAYLEAPGRSWPAWRRTVGHDEATLTMVAALAGLFPTDKLELVLASHSGGGALVCAWLNAVPEIPDNVVRVAFLDSDYAYLRAEHAAKLERWLAAPADHYLCVLAYHDALARLNGKPFVTEAGGTWGRSHALLADLGGPFRFTSRTNDSLETVTALDGRIQLVLHENPAHTILHTVQVERNGFIQAMVSGTALEGRGYTYFGARAYTNWITGPEIRQRRRRVQPGADPAARGPAGARRAAAAAGRRAGRHRKRGRTGPGTAGHRPA